MSNNNNNFAAQYILALNEEPCDIEAFDKDVLDRFPKIKRGDMIAVWLSLPKQNEDLVCWLSDGAINKDELWYVWSGRSALAIKRFINCGELPKEFSAPEEFPIDHWSGNRNSFGSLLIVPFDHLKYRESIEKSLTYEITDKSAIVRAYFKCNGRAHSFIIPDIKFSADEWTEWKPRIAKAIFAEEDMGPLFLPTHDDLNHLASDRTFFATFCYEFGGKDVEWFDE